MSQVEIFENERATSYNQFVETWIPNYHYYHYFLDRLPKLLSDTNQKDLLVVGCGTENEIDQKKDCVNYVQKQDLNRRFAFFNCLFIWVG